MPRIYPIAVPDFLEPLLTRPIGRFVVSYWIESALLALRQ